MNKHDDKLSMVIDKLSMGFEEMGMPRMAGKVFLSLYLSDSGYKSTKELIEMSGGSKGSISIMTRMMVQVGLLEKISVHGKRGTFYKLTENPIVEVFKRKIETLNRLQKTEKECFEILGDDYPEETAKLKEMYYFHEFVLMEMPIMLMKWVEKRNEIIAQFNSNEKGEK